MFTTPVSVFYNLDIKIRAILDGSGITPPPFPLWNAYVETETFTSAARYPRKEVVTQNVS